MELEDGALNVLKVIPFKQKGKLQFMELEPNEVSNTAKNLFYRGRGVTGIMELCDLCV